MGPMPINGMQISPQPPPPPSPPPSLLPPLKIGQIWFLVQKDVQCYETCEKKNNFYFSSYRENSSKIGVIFSTKWSKMTITQKKWGGEGGGGGWEGDGVLHTVNWDRTFITPICTLYPIFKMLVLPHFRPYNLQMVNS